jgi:hypothetical protein
METALGGSEVEYESTEPWVYLNFSRSGKNINMLTRFSIALGVGPIIEYNVECREDEIRNTLRDLVTVVKAFPYVQAEV